MSVAIIDYGMGNVASVQKAFNFLNVESVVTRDFATIENAQYILLPGVGSFRQGISNLKDAGLFDFLTTQVMERKKPFLGICLGMQLIASKGTEPVDTEGLNWVKGEVVKIDVKEKRIPHLGWNTISGKEDTIFADVANRDFYFIHSYHFKVQDESAISSVVNYGIDMVSGIQKDNIYAAQFHPEKSQEAGLSLLKNFLKANA